MVLPERQGDGAMNRRTAHAVLKKVFETAGFNPHRNT